MTDELIKKADLYANHTHFTEYDNPSLSESLDISEEIKQAYIAGAKAMQEENEQQEMMITCNEKIDDLRRMNKKLKTKLENTERKIREISQKCYEVEDIESIISDLDNLSMELEE